MSMATQETTPAWHQSDKSCTEEQPHGMKEAGGPGRSSACFGSLLPAAGMNQAEGNPVIHTTYQSARASTGAGLEGEDEEVRSVRQLGVITGLGQGARLLQRPGGDRLPPATPQSWGRCEATCSTALPAVCPTPGCRSRK